MRRLLRFLASLLRRPRRRCGHKSYEGAAGVICMVCKQDRERLAEHVRSTTRRTG